MTSMNVKKSEQWPDSWLTLPNGLRKGRYTDLEFARLERDKLWGQVWQFAARLDEIPEVGDYTTYEIVDQSIMLVRSGEDTVKGYFNFCPHRGTTLSEGSGTFENNTIICPFHGWKWDLEGANKYVLEEHEFHDGKLCKDDVGLRAVHTAVFEGFVFISMARDPIPFDDFIAPVRERIESLRLGVMHHYWWKRVEGPANWKIAQEAFHETYHVAATHPQLDEVGANVIYKDADPDNAVMMHAEVGYEACEHGHGRFWDNRGTTVNVESAAPSEAVLESMIGFMQLLNDGMDAMYLQEDLETAKSLRGKPVPEGSGYGEEFVKALYAKAAEQGRPMPAPEPEVITQWGGEIFVFPNLLILPGPGRVMMYRIRPNGLDPDACIFEIFSTTGYQADEKPPRAEVFNVTGPTDPRQLLLIPRQDFSNIPRIQIGLHSFGCREVWLASHNEKIVMNMHRELDRYLQSPD